MSTENDVTLFMLDMDGTMVPDADGEWVRAEAYYELEAKRFTPPEGFVLVPVEPTVEMLGEIQLVENFTGSALRARYAAMLAARPEVTP